MSQYDAKLEFIENKVLRERESIVIHNQGASLRYLSVAVNRSMTKSLVGLMVVEG